MTASTDHSEMLQEIPDPADLTTRYEIGVVRQHNPQAGKIGWAILWLLGIPLPVLLVIYFIWGR
jgi:hypothetical protein